MLEGSATYQIAKEVTIPKNKNINKFSVLMWSFKIVFSGKSPKSSFSCVLIVEYIKGNAAKTVKNTIDKDANSLKIHKLNKTAIEEKINPAKNTFVLLGNLLENIKDSNTIVKILVKRFK